jgi:hypothetical protein
MHPVGQPSPKSVVSYFKKFVYPLALWLGLETWPCGTQRHHQKPSALGSSPTIRRQQLPWPDPAQCPAIRCLQPEWKCSQSGKEKQKGHHLLRLRREGPHGQAVQQAVWQRPKQRQGQRLRQRTHSRWPPTAPDDASTSRSAGGLCLQFFSASELVFAVYHTGTSLSLPHPIFFY